MTELSDLIRPGQLPEATRVRLNSILAMTPRVNNALFFGIGPDRTPTQNMVGIDDAYGEFLENGAPIWFPPGRITVARDGTPTGAIGAWLTNSTGRNPDKKALWLMGCGVDGTVLEMEGGCQFNVLEWINSTTNSVQDLPMTVCDLTLDGNGANQTQHIGGDTWQNGFAGRNVRGLRMINVKVVGASYHGAILNNCRDYKLWLEAVDNYCNGLVLTGNPALDDDPRGLLSYVQLIARSNGIVQADQIDTTYMGFVCIEQLALIAHVSSAGHLNHQTNVITPASGGAALINTSEACNITIVSENDYSGLQIDGSTNGCTFNLDVANATECAIIDVNKTANSITGNTFNVNLRNNAKHMSLGEEAGAGFIYGNKFTGTMTDLSGASPAPMVTLGPQETNNIYTGLNVGDVSGSGNVSAFVDATASGGGSEFTAITSFGSYTDDMFVGVTGANLVRNVPAWRPPTSTPAIGASPYTLPVLPYDALYVLTTLNGITGATLDGVAVAITLNSTVRVNHEQTFVVSHGGAAPVYTVIPQV